MSIFKSEFYASFTYLIVCWSNLKSGVLEAGSSTHVDVIVVIVEAKFRVMNFILANVDDIGI